MSDARCSDYDLPTLLGAAPGTVVRQYARLLADLPHQADLLEFNLALARRHWRAARRGRPLHVAACGWELAHNAAGRVRVLADLWGGLAETEVIGSIFPRWGDALWPPIRDMDRPCHTIHVTDNARFPRQALDFVLAHPYDVVHLSKPRFPNIVFGLIYKLVWDARVILDIDDEELGAIKAETPLSLDDLLGQMGGTPCWKNLGQSDWTRAAVTLWDIFDEITVSNPALQERYGGAVIPHARDAEQFTPSSERQAASPALSALLDKACPLPAPGMLLPNPKQRDLFDRLDGWRMFRTQTPGAAIAAPTPVSAQAQPAAGEAGRLVVYSVLVGDYEPVKEPEALDPAARYILFTDDPDLRSDTWEVIPFDTQGLPPRRASRLPKLLPHRYLPDHDISIYIDASLRMVEPDITTMTADCLQGRDIAAYPHFERDCTYDEIERCLEVGKANTAQAEPFRQRLVADSFPARYGLLENAFLIRRNTESIRAMNEEWHSLYSKGAERDQFYLMYLLWKRNLPFATIANSRNFRKSPYTKFTPHHGVSARPAQGAGKRLITWRREVTA